MKKKETDILDEEIDLDGFPFGSYDEDTGKEEDWEVPSFEDEEEDDLPADEDEEYRIEDLRMYTEDELKASRKSLLFPDVTVSEGQEYSTIGYSRKNLLYDSVTNYYDGDHHIGYSRRSPLAEDLTVYYDADGKRIGYSRKSLIDDGITRYYDKKGKYLGKARKSFLYDNINKFFKKK